GRKLTVGLDREGKHCRHPGAACGADETGRFNGLVEGHAAHQVSFGPDEPTNLFAEVVLGLAGWNDDIWFVGIAARAGDRIEHDRRRIPDELLPQVRDEAQALLVRSL